jgi:hypothetical protein
MRKGRELRQIRIKFTGNVSPRLQKFVLGILNHKDAAWQDPSSTNPLQFVSSCSSKEEAHISLGFYKNDDIVTRLGAAFDGLSAAATRGALPRDVYINFENFTFPPSHFPSKQKYREYVIRHEVGHALGMNHIPSSSPGPCNVMTPQTIPLDCAANSQPTHEDKTHLRRNFYL